MNTITATPSRCAKRDRLRELRRQLMRQWKYNRPGSNRRVLLERLVSQIDSKIKKSYTEAHLMTAQEAKQARPPLKRITHHRQEGGHAEGQKLNAGQQQDVPGASVFSANRPTHRELLDKDILVEECTDIIADAMNCHDRDARRRSA